MLTKQAKQDKLLKGNEQADITRPVTHARNDLRLYEKRTEQGHEKAALFHLRSYYKNLAEIKREVIHLGKREELASFANEVLQLIEKIRRYSPPL